MYHKLCFIDETVSVAKVPASDVDQTKFTAIASESATTDKQTVDDNDESPSLHESPTPAADKNKCSEDNNLKRGLNIGDPCVTGHITGEFPPSAKKIRGPPNAAADNECSEENNLRHGTNIGEPCITGHTITGE